MGSRFLLAFVGAFLATLTGLSVIGSAITLVTVSQPREPFRAGSFEFLLASGWWCEREGAEYTCNPVGKPPYAATVIMAVKERNGNDNLDAYEQHLQTPQKTVVNQGDAAALSEVRYVTRRRLGATDWIEALHVGSEIKNYYTYYLATSTASLGILVSMSVHKDHLETYRQQVTDMMATLNTYQR